MRTRNVIKIMIICLSFLVVSCNSGYQKNKDKWTWVSYDEAVGKREGIIKDVDFETFIVLDDKKYAKDKNNVYYNGEIIEYADPNTFRVLDNNGYSKDSINVFLDWTKILFGNPKTFTLLEFPYSKDSERIFCGTLPLNIDKNEVSEFKVTNENESISGMKSTIILSEFIRLNPEYEWIDSLEVKEVIIVEWATGKTNKKKVKGFKVAE